MGAMVFRNTIWISKELLEKINDREKRVIMAHELSHYIHKDNIKMTALRVLLFFCPFIVNSISKKIEMRADRESIIKTRDVSAFKSLIDKLNRKGSRYPSKKESLRMADEMAGVIWK